MFNKLKAKLVEKAVTKLTKIKNCKLNGGLQVRDWNTNEFVCEFMTPIKEETNSLVTFFLEIRI